MLGIDHNSLSVQLQGIIEKGRDASRQSNERSHAQQFMQSLMDPSKMKDIMGVLSNVLGMMGAKGL